jgi:hypothetical protein
LLANVPLRNSPSAPLRIAATPPLGLSGGIGVLSDFQDLGPVWKEVKTDPILLFTLAFFFTFEQYPCSLGAAGENAFFFTPIFQWFEEMLPLRENMAHPKTPKWRKCRDCDYRPEKKVFSTTCPRCTGVMRVIKYG